MFIKGRSYVRLVSVPIRWGPFTFGTSIYEVMTEPGVTRFVALKYLGGVVRYDPRGDQRDMEKCLMVTDQLLKEDRTGDWVEFSTGIVVRGESLKGESFNEEMMNTNVTALTTDMLRFSELLEIMKNSTLARNYANMARTLESEPSDEAVEEVREWVRLTVKGGAGSLNDLYVQKDGEVDSILNPEYEELLQRLTDFANG